MELWRRFVELLLWTETALEGHKAQKPLDLPDSIVPVPHTKDVSPAVPDYGGHWHEFAKGTCNTPDDRACWTKGFDIDTDYEDFTPDGKVREYYLVVSNEKIAPDGYLVDRMLINGTYPGPLIEANWGDTLRVTVRNNLTNFNGTSIHWHGVRQLNTTFQDGVAGITQCPIPPGEEYTYEFRAHQYGTSWYHSHFSLQYPDGIAGPLRIYGPSSKNYDVDLKPLLITDWLHTDAFGQYIKELQGAPPPADSYLLNGKGQYFCCPSLDPQCTGELKVEELTLQRGLSHKISIVNTAVATHFTFWIDGHDFDVIATDFVPVKPYRTDTINVAIGQRYDIVLPARPREDNDTRESFWINIRDCQNLNIRSNIGILRYNDSKSTGYPWTPPASRLCYGCGDEPSEGGSFSPIVQRKPPPPPGFTDGNTLEVGMIGYPNANDPNSILHKWELANSSLYLDWAQPSLSLLSIAGDKLANPFPPQYAPVFLDGEIGSWVYFLIEGKFTNSDQKTYRTPIPLAHPIHVHGHDFLVLAQANETFTGNVSLNLDNPTRRDVAMLPVNGFLVIAFQVNNPGAWLMHCHIAWHASSGLALQFVEKPGMIKPLLEEAGVLPGYYDMCSRWGAYYKVFNEKNNATQEDSGI